MGELWLWYVVVAALIVWGVFVAQSPKDSNSPLPREMRDKDADTLATLYTREELARVSRAVGAATPDVLTCACQIARAEEELEAERKKAQEAAEYPYTLKFHSGQLFFGWGHVDSYRTQDEAVDKAKSMAQAVMEAGEPGMYRVEHDGVKVWP